MALDTTLEAIVLAGGLGTRLRAVVPDLPKPMAPVNGRPFLAYLLKFLKSQGVSRVILSVGYQSDAISSYFKDEFDGLEVCYSVETELLGTGGGIRLALSKCRGPQAYILNGDTYFEVNLSRLAAYHHQKHADVTLALKPMANADRYGTVMCDATGRVVQFCEKQSGGSSLINGGVYVVNTSVFQGIELASHFSFESDFLATHLTVKCIFGWPDDGCFIDIGIPEDYAKAGQLLSELAL